MAIISLKKLSWKMVKVGENHYILKSQGIWKLRLSDNPLAGVKVFRMIPEFRILRLTFHRKSASKC